MDVAVISVLRELTDLALKDADVRELIQEMTCNVSLINKLDLIIYCLLITQHVPVTHPEPVITSVMSPPGSVCVVPMPMVVPVMNVRRVSMASQAVVHVGVTDVLTGVTLRLGNVSTVLITPQALAVTGNMELLNMFA